MMPPALQHPIEHMNAAVAALQTLLRMPDRKVMVKIHLPTIRAIFPGARLAFGLGWRVNLAAETPGSSGGVGYRLRQAADLIQTDHVFAWTIPLVLVMAALEMGVLRLQIGRAHV